MGRNLKIETPEIMYKIFCDYKKWAKDNPILVHDFVGKDGDQKKKKKERPLTFEGFEVWCWDNSIAEGVEQYFSNRDNRYEKFVGVCSRIRREIRNDQIVGGMVGTYNTSITQRLNGLVEKSEVKSEVTEIKVTKE